MKTPNQINKYYDQRLHTVELLTKKRLDNFVIKNELEFERLQMKLERKKQSTIKKIELDRKKKLKSLETGKPLVKKEKKINRVKKLDDARSLYIRTKYGTKCYTCGGTESVWCGHFLSRKCRKLRREENNTRPQCWRICNAKFSGNGKPVEFEKKLKDEWINTDELKRIYLEPNPKPKEYQIIEKFNALTIEIIKLCSKEKKTPDQDISTMI